MHKYYNPRILDKNTKKNWIEILKYDESAVREIIEGEGDTNLLEGYMPLNNV